MTKKQIKRMFKHRSLSARNTNRNVIILFSMAEIYAAGLMLKALHERYESGESWIYTDRTGKECHWVEIFDRIDNFAFKLYRQLILTA